eukprot:2860787-Alexandrium_andersonii.AAC.1
MRVRVARVGACACMRARVCVDALTPHATAGASKARALVLRVCAGERQCPVVYVAAREGECDSSRVLRALSCTHERTLAGPRFAWHPG